jgi:NADH-quinone oxidoreductase subunit J
MLLNAGREERTLGSKAAAIVGFPAVVALLAVLATVVLHAPSLDGAAFGDNLSNQPGKTNLDQLSTVLFTNLLLPFEVTSVLILIAILGAVALARHGNGERTAGE